MKVLKRPMFKYGGGVKKQGIMHGMKGMQDGGPATMADATGYANGGMTMFPPMRGRVTRPGGYAGKEIMENRIPMQAPIENFYKNNQANVTGDYSKINQPPEILTRDERIQKQKDVYKPSYTIQDLYEKNMNVTDEQIPKNTRAGVVMVDNPNYGRVKRLDKVNTGSGDPNDITGGNLTREIIPAISTGSGDPNDIKGLPKTSLPKISREETDAKRLKRIYEIMDVDGAKKDAAYNALIDLSQGQAIDTKDISGSINRAIGALSKRADKVTDLKDKGKAALASGTMQAEITKEINREKGTAYDQKEKYFTGKLGDVKGERAAVGSPLSVYDALITTKAGDSKSTRTEQAVTKYFDGIGGVPVYKGPIPGIELETIKINEETEKADGAYRIGTGYIVVEKGIITEKKDLFPKK